MLTYAIFAYA